MKITHLTTITARLNPFSSASKVPRLILALLPPNAHKSVQIKATQLPRTSTLPAILEVGFKDGKTMKWEWTGASNTTITAATSDDSNNKKEKSVSIAEIVEEINRHTRMLSRKEELSG